MAVLKNERNLQIFRKKLLKKFGSFACTTFLCDVAPREAGLYQCFYQPDSKTLCSIQGSFTPIDNLDTNPRISENLARHIAQAYITKDEGEFKDYSMNSRLRIASFIKEGQTFVHLVYYCTYTKEGWSNFYDATIDAQTGRVLSYSMGIP